MIKKKWMVAAATVAVAALALTGCSNDADSSSSGSNSTLSAAAQAALTSAFTGIGGNTLVDLTNVSSELKSLGSQTVYVVSCGEQVPSCHEPAQAVVDAAKAAGWNATIADGKLSPDGFAAAIRQGISGGASIIVPIGIGCGVAQAAFQDAVNAGIKIIGGGGVDDCSPKLWTSERNWLSDYTPEQFWNAQGALQADYEYGINNGDVKAVVLNFTSQSWGPWITAGYEAEMTKLGGSAPIATVDVSDAENADGSYVQKVVTALLNNPTANALVVPVDGWLTGGLASALVQNSLASKLQVIGRSGDESALNLIRQGGAGINATVGYATEWGAWGSIDTAIRALSGQTVVDIGEQLQVVDATHNMPDSGSYAGTKDFKSAFKTAWGVS